MRHTLILLFLLAYFKAFSQNEVNKCQSEVDSLTKIKVYSRVDQMPGVKGGMPALFKEVGKRIQYPKKINEMGIETKVFVAFVIMDDGTVTGTRILKEIEGADLADQLLNIIIELKWQPGLCDGKPVPTIMRLPMIIDVK